MLASRNTVHMVFRAYAAPGKAALRRIPAQGFYTLELFDRHDSYCPTF